MANGEEDAGGEKRGGDRVKPEATAGVNVEAEGRFAAGYGLERLRDEIGRVDEHLDEPVDAYLLGGCAMAYADLKPATKDIDVVQEDRDAFDTLAEALVAAGYERVEPRGPYDAMRIAGVFDRDDAPRWDLFIREVCGQLQLSPGMVERAERIEEGLAKLRLHRVQPSDIFIFKSITPRAGDRADMDTILAEALDWEGVLEEMRWQSRSSHQTWTPMFAQVMRELADEGREVPILDELEELADREAGEWAALRAVEDGARTREDVTEVVGEDPAWVGELVDDLLERGELTEQRGRLERGER